MASRWQKYGGKIWLVLFFGAAAVGLFFIYLRFNPFDAEAWKIWRLESEMKILQDQYKNDTYGGTTPEETLKMFIEALKKGDTDLAAKYFVIESQDKWRADLSGVKDKGLLPDMVKDLERKNYKYSITSDRVAFDIPNDKNEVALTIHITKISSGRWKIEDF